MKKLILFLFLYCCINKCATAQNTGAGNATQQNYLDPVYQELPLGAIRPKGWLQHQLEIMARGSTGHLDEVYDLLKNDNGWLGGRGDNWEQTPYWLDGALPLAYLLNDEDLKRKVLSYVQWTITNQRPSGYFGPITKAERAGKTITPDSCHLGEDWWPKMIMLKVLQQYYTATRDARVISFMTKFFQYQLSVLQRCPIGKWTEWAHARGTDNALIAQWLYSITRDPSLLKLASLIESQSAPWSNWLGGRDWVISAATYQNDRNWMSRHGVNVGMGLKAPAVNYQRTADRMFLTALKTGFNDLMTLHGLPMGIFSSDEDLHGNDPTQGAELCAVVEAMFSLEQAIALTGDLHYADALERMAFNALPAQTSDDYNLKQYFQVANQVQISRGVFNFSLPFERGMNNVLGMRSGYTCCLANMHQGWTKFASHLWYGTAGGGIAAMAYSSNEVTTKLGKTGVEVTIKEETNYPFDDRINFGISLKKEASFPLQLRIPSWCKTPVVLLNGERLQPIIDGQLITLTRSWKDKDRLTLHLPMEAYATTWGRNSRAIERGPLVYALKVGERWEKGTEEKEGAYFSVYPTTAWNYGLTVGVARRPATNATVRVVSPIADDFVWNAAHAPIEIRVAAKKIPAWTVNADGAAMQPVTDRTGIYRGLTGPEEQVTLIPYGCTKIRIVAFPVVP